MIVSKIRSLAVKEIRFETMLEAIPMTIDLFLFRKSTKPFIYFEDGSSKEILPPRSSSIFDFGNFTQMIPNTIPLSDMSNSTVGFASQADLDAMQIADIISKSNRKIKFRFNDRSGARIEDFFDRFAESPELMENYFFEQIVVEENGDLLNFEQNMITGNIVIDHNNISISLKNIPKDMDIIGKKLSRWNDKQENTFHLRFYRDHKIKWKRSIDKNGYLSFAWGPSSAEKVNEIYNMDHNHFISNIIKHVLNEEINEF